MQSKIKLCLVPLFQVKYPQCMRNCYVVWPRKYFVLKESWTLTSIQKRSPPSCSGKGNRKLRSSPDRCAPWTCSLSDRALCSYIVGYNRLLEIIFEDRISMGPGKLCQNSTREPIPDTVDARRRSLWIRTARTSWCTRSGCWWCGLSFRFISR